MQEASNLVSHRRLLSLERGVRGRHSPIGAPKTNARPHQLGELAATVGLCPSRSVDVIPAQLGPRLALFEVGAATHPTRLDVWRVARATRCVVMDLLRCCISLSAVLELVMICVASVFICPKGCHRLNPYRQPSGLRLQARPALRPDDAERHPASTHTHAQTDGGLIRRKA